MKQEQIVHILNEVSSLEISGEYDAAMARLRPWLEISKPRPRIVAAYARLSVHFDEKEKALALVEDALKNFSLPSPLESSLHFHAGNLYDKLKEYDDAFVHYAKANSALPAQFNIQAYKSFIKTQRQFFTKTTMKNLQRADNIDEVPVFIVGMPRSGTTLTEQILDRHSQIYGAGELTTINEIMASVQQRYSLKSQYPSCLLELTTGQLNNLAELYRDEVNPNAQEHACITDKMPSNCGHLGLIELILPAAKVIHCRRHPFDTCLSAYFQNFGNAHQYSRRLEYLAQMYRMYLKMVGMWDGVINLPVYELRYEDMVKDQQEVSRQLIEFCGFDWEDQCLRFNESKREINTCSYNQVRKPLYTSSVHRWKNYEKHIGPLVDELEDIAAEYDSGRSESERAMH